MAMLKGAVLAACLALANARRGAVIGPVCCKELLSLLPCWPPLPLLLPVRVVSEGVPAPCFTSVTSVLSRRRAAD